MTQVQMPAYSQRRVLSRQRNGVDGAGLAHHQRGAVQRAFAMGAHDGAVGFRVQPEVIGNENDFQFQVRSL